MTKQIKIIQGQCPTCDDERNAYVRAEHEDQWSDEERPILWGTSSYRILECGGCETVYFQKTTTFSEDQDYKHNPVTGEVEAFLPERKTYWPKHDNRTKPAWSFKLNDEGLKSLYDEIYLAFNNESRTLATIGIRTAFDRASELLDIEPELPFKDKLKELDQARLISTIEKDALEVLTDAGSAAAHRAWRPSMEEVDSLLSILEAFLQRNFIIPSEAEAVKKSVPPRKKKKS